MPDVGPLELVIVLAIVLIFFGPKRLPGLGKQLGSGMREFRDSITGRHDKAEAAAEEPSVAQAVEARNDAAGLGDSKPAAAAPPAKADDATAEPSESS
jgi:sec-independent protein translocase protein TatA